MNDNGEMKPTKKDVLEKAYRQIGTLPDTFSIFRKHIHKSVSEVILNEVMEESVP